MTRSQGTQKKPYVPLCPSSSGSGIRFALQFPLMHAICKVQLGVEWISSPAIAAWTFFTRSSRSMIIGPKKNTFGLGWKFCFYFRNTNMQQGDKNVLTASLTAIETLSIVYIIYYLNHTRQILVSQEEFVYFYWIAYNQCIFLKRRSKTWGRGCQVK